MQQQQQSHQGMNAGGGNQRQDAAVGQGDNASKKDASSIFEQGDKSNTTFTNADLFRNPVLVQALLQGGGLVGGASSSEQQQSVNTTAQQDNSNAAMLRQFLPASNTTTDPVQQQQQQSSNPTMQLLQQLPQEFLASALNATGSENNVNISRQQSMMGGADALQTSGTMTNLITNNNMIQGGGGFTQQQQDFQQAPPSQNNNIQQQQQVQNFQQQQDTNMSSTSFQNQFGNNNSIN